MSITRIGERKRITTKFTKPSLTRADMAQMCDINVIVAKTQNNEFVLASSHRPEYGDFTLDMPYDKMLEQIQEANDAFYALPAEERRKYGDDPAAWLHAQETRIENEAAEAQAKAAKEEAKKAKAKKIAEAKETLGIDDVSGLEKPKE